jgi:AraC-like DNA-binding protein
MRRCPEPRVSSASVLGLYNAISLNSARAIVRCLQKSVSTRPANLLVESDYRIVDIAKRLGFADASSFNRTFQRLMKIQPGAYRKQQSAVRCSPHQNEKRRNGRR